MKRDEIDGVPPPLPPPRERCIDPDYRREPRTDFFCVRCQRDILRVRGSEPPPQVYVRENGHVIVHAADVERAMRSGDIGWQTIGWDCARLVGIDWCKRA